MVILVASRVDTTRLTISHRLCCIAIGIIIGKIVKHVPGERSLKTTPDVRRGRQAGARRKSEAAVRPFIF